MSFKKGDIIDLRENSRFEHQRSGKGIIIAYEPANHNDFKWRVRWENGAMFWYRLKDMVYCKEYIVSKILKEIDENS